MRRLVISVHEEGEGGFQFIGLAGGKDFVQFGGSFDGIVDAALAVVVSCLVGAAVLGVIALEEEQQVGVILAKKEFLIVLAGCHVIAGGDEVEFVIRCSQHGVNVEGKVVVNDFLGGAAAGDNVMADDFHVATGHILLLGMAVEFHFLFGGAIGGSDAGHLGFSHLLGMGRHGRQCHQEHDEWD